MARGGGSAVALLLVITLAWAAVLHCEGSTTYTVGDAQGWGIQVPYARWAVGKRFKAGDTLVFKYAAGVHNVVPVTANGYNSCKTVGGARPLTSGSDRVTLKRGLNYYICSLPGHCEAGMKIAVKAA